MKSVQNVFTVWLILAGRHLADLEVPMNFFAPCLPVFAVATPILPSCPARAQADLTRHIRSWNPSVKAKRYVRCGFLRTTASRKAAEADLVFSMSLTAAEVQIHGACSQFNNRNSFHAPMFHSKLSELVELIILSPKGFACDFLFLSQLIL